MIWRQIHMDKILNEHFRLLYTNIEHEEYDSRSHSAERRGGHLPQGWSETEFGEGQRTTAPPTTVTSSSVESQGGRSSRRGARGGRSPSLTSDLDPEAVGYTLREMLRQLAQLEKERDDALMSKRVCEEQLLVATSQLSEHSDEVQQLRHIINSLEEGNTST